MSHHLTLRAHTPGDISAARFLGPEAPPSSAAMSSSTDLSSADPVDLGAQSDLIGAPEPMSIEAVLADQIAAGRALLMTFDVT